MTAPRMAPAATRIGAGCSAPLGATPSEEGVNFSIFSRHATAMEMLLFDAVDDARPAQAIRIDPIANRTYHYWHVFVPDVRPGQIYGYRVEGPSDPARGLRFDYDKVLLDPYGRGVVVPDGYRRAAAAERGDNAATAMKSVVVDPNAYDWEGDAPLRRPSARTIVYETHVRGFTRHPSSGVGEKTRGSYASLIEKIPYLRDLGVTAVELLPVFQFDAQAAPNEVNYWGYQPVSFFAPHQAYSSRRDPLGPVDEFRDMVKGAPPGGPRGHPRGRVQPYGGGWSRWAHAVLPGPGQRDVLHPGARPRALRRLHRLWKHAQRQRPHRPPADRRQSPVLGRGDARGRLPLRSRVDPHARRVGRADAESTRPLGHRVGPGARRHQALRRGLGRGGPVPGGQLRRGQLEGVERTVPRRRERLLPRRARVAPALRRPPGRQPRDLRPQAARARAERQLRDLSRRLHAQRSGLVRPEAQRGERRAEPRRRRRQPELELWRRRPHQRSRRREAPEPPGEELPHRHDAIHRSADDRDGRRGPPDPGRQQQRLLPGQRDELVRLDAAHKARRRAPVRHPAQRPAAPARHGARAPAREPDRDDPHGQQGLARRQAQPAGLAGRFAQHRVHRGDAKGEDAGPHHPERLLGAARLRAATGGRRRGRALAALDRHRARLPARHRALADRPGASRPDLSRRGALVGGAVRGYGILRAAHCGHRLTR